MKKIRKKTLMRKGRVTVKNPLFLFALTLTLSLFAVLKASFLPLFFVFLLVFSASVIRLALRRKTKYTKILIAVGFALSLACALSIVVRFGMLERFRVFEGRECTVEGMVLDAPTETEYGYSYVVTIQKLSAGGDAFQGGAKAILYTGFELEMSAFDTFSGKVKFYPRKEKLYETAVDFDEINLSKGIYFRMSASENEFKVTGNESGRHPLRALAVMFSNRSRTVNEEHLGDYYGNFLHGMVTGRKGGLDNTIVHSLQKTSLSHILAVSEIGRAHV